MSLHQKIISIGKIPAILQAFKVVISCPTTEHGGIWVGPLQMSSKDRAQNTQETFDWVSSTVKTNLCFIFYRKRTRLLNERTVSSSNTIQSLATISTATIYIYIFFRFRGAGRKSSPPYCQSWSTICQPFGLIKVKTLDEELTYNYWGVIKMSMSTNMFAEKFIFLLCYCRLLVRIQSQLLNKLCTNISIASYTNLNISF